MTWEREDIEDLMADAISDSMDMDWTARDGARAVQSELDRNGLSVVPTWSLVPSWLLLGGIIAAIITAAV